MSELPETRINENAIKAWRISAILFGLILYAVPGVLFFLYLNGALQVIAPMVAGPAAFFTHLFLIFVFPKIRWSRWRYDVTEQGVDMYRGIIILKRTVVPVNRIQHVDTKQGPIYRKFGLSSISISTAATTHEIPALDDETAAQLRAMISDLVRKAKEDV
ncbi:MAG: PH domain-containing protein [Balneola sp.]